MNRSIARIIALVLTVALIGSCLFFPASAAEYEDLAYFDAIEAGFVGSWTSSSGSYKRVSLSFTSNLNIQYVDFVCYSSVDLTSSGVTVSYNQSYVLDVVSLGNGLYRCFGSSSSYKGSVSNSYIYFAGSSTSSATMSLKSLHLGCSAITSFPDITFFEVTYGIFSGESGTSVSAAMDSVAGSTRVTFPTDTDSEGWYQFRSYVYFDDWIKYDYADVVLRLKVGTVDSIAAYTNDGVVIPCDISYLITDSSGEFVTVSENQMFLYPDVEPTDVFISIRADFTGIDRAAFSSDDAFIRVTGTYDSSTETQPYFSVLRYTGHVVTSLPDPVAHFVKSINTTFQQFRSQFTAYSNNLNTWLDNLGTRIENALNPQPDIMTSAIESQLEVNVQINEQMSQSIDEWNTQHLVLSDSADSAVLSATPALAWLSSIADTLFKNMGWFGTMYFFVGLLSIYFLLLSKSGLAHKISNSIGSDKYPNKKN